MYPVLSVRTLLPGLKLPAKVGFNLLVDRSGKLLRSKTKVSKKDVEVNCRASLLANIVADPDPGPRALFEAHKQNNADRTSLYMPYLGKEPLHEG